MLVNTVQIIVVTHLVIYSPVVKVLPTFTNRESSKGKTTTSLHLHHFVRDLPIYLEMCVRSDLTGLVCHEMAPNCKTMLATSITGNLNLDMESTAPASTDYMTQ